VTGVFISMEGIEGTGKSTQARMLSENLRSRGMEVMLTHEPGGTVISQRIREVLLLPEHKGMDPVTELLLYAAARRQHVAEVILPALRGGQVVVTDRFSDSTRAYQGHARGIDMEIIEALERMATGGLRPELTVLLDIEAKEGLSRNRGANKVDRLELEDLEFHEKVREGYLAIERAEPERVKLISALGSVEEVQERVVGAVTGFLKRSG
jgi:dTMP kinase